MAGNDENSSISHTCKDISLSVEVHVCGQKSVASHTLLIWYSILPETRHGEVSGSYIT